MSRRIAAILCLLALALPTAAAPPAAKPAPSARFLSVDGMTLPVGVWKVIEFTGRPVKGGIVLTLAFDKGQIRGRSGCNRYVAQATAAGEALTIGPAQVTRMACPEDVMFTERAFLGALAAANRFASAEGRLTLYADKFRLLRAVPGQ